jgi:hypothetical protein
MWAFSSYTFGAVYGDAAGDLVSVGSTTFAVGAAPSRATLSASTTATTLGAPVTFTATGLPLTTSAIGFPGGIIFYDGDQTLGSGDSNIADANHGGVTNTLTVTSMGVGTHRITARYYGAPYFQDSTSPTITVTVALAA